jgi:hypothetical protein
MYCSVKIYLGGSKKFLPNIDNVCRIASETTNKPFEEKKLNWLQIEFEEMEIWGRRLQNKLSS